MANIDITNHPILSKYATLLEKKDPEVTAKLLAYEVHWNWVGAELNKKEAETVLKRFEDEAYGSDSDESSESGMDPGGETPAFGVNDEEGNDTPESKWFPSLAKAFLLIFLGQSEDAGHLLEEVSENIALVRPEATETEDPELSLTIEACNYMLAGLQTYLGLVNGNANCSEILRQPEFHQLSALTRSRILRAKLCFFGSSRKYFNEIVRTYEDLMTLQPDSVTHCLGYHFYARILRRQKTLSSAPSSKETEAAIRAFTLSPMGIHPMAISCLNMAELVRQNYADPSNWPYVYGQTTFHSADEMVAEIKRRARKYQSFCKEENLERAIETNMFEPLFNLSAVFSSVLPYHYNDLPLARLFIDFCVLIRPRTVIAQHRSALLLIKENSTDASGSKEARSQAEQILRSVSGGDMIFYPMYDLFNLMLGDINKNHEELETRLSENIGATEQWSQAEIAKLYFLRGCLNFMLMKFKLAFDDWIQAYTLDKESNHFESLPLSTRRFFWDRKLIRLNLIRDELEKLGFGSFPVDCHPILEFITKRVDNVLAEQELRNANRPRRFSGPHGNQRGSFGDGFGNGGNGEQSWRNRNVNETGQTGRGQNRALANNNWQPPPSDGPSRQRSSHSFSVADSDDNWRRK